MKNESNSESIQTDTLIKLCEHTSGDVRTGSETSNQGRQEPCTHDHPAFSGRTSTPFFGAVPLACTFGRRIPDDQAIIERLPEDRAQHEEGERAAVLAGDASLGSVGGAGGRAALSG